MTPPLNQALRDRFLAEFRDDVDKAKGKSIQLALSDAGIVLGIIDELRAELEAARRDSDIARALASKWSRTAGSYRKRHVLLFALAEDGGPADGSHGRYVTQLGTVDLDRIPGLLLSLIQDIEGQSTPIDPGALAAANAVVDRTHELKVDHAGTFASDVHPEETDFPPESLPTGSDE